MAGTHIKQGARKKRRAVGQPRKPLSEQRRRINVSLPPELYRQIEALNNGGNRSRTVEGLLRIGIAARLRE